MSAVSKHAINKNIFFLIADKELAVWNYETHEQYVMSKAHICTLMAIAAGENVPDDSICADLRSANILTCDLSARSTPDWGWDALARIFHLGTSISYADFPAGEEDPAQRSQQYAEQCTSIRDSIPEDAFTYEKGEAALPLEKSEKANPINLFDVLRDRTSTRNFTGESVVLESIATVLREAFGYREHLLGKYHEKGLDTPTRRRSSPSGGSLQCSEAYLVARNVNGLPPGVYHYRSHSNNLAFIRGIPESTRFGSEYLAGQAFSDDADAFIVITSRLQKMWWKYRHSRAYRVACFDVGHLSQTVQLIATGLALRTWTTAAFFDDKLRSLLAVGSDETEYPMLVIGLGTGEVDPVDKYYRAVLE